jgi:hypothetical protein
LRKWNSAGCCVSRTQPSSGGGAVAAKVIARKLAHFKCSPISNRFTDPNPLSTCIAFCFTQPEPHAFAFAIASRDADATACADGGGDDASTASTASTAGR